MRSLLGALLAVVVATGLAACSGPVSPSGALPAPAGTQADPQPTATSGLESAVERVTDGAPLPAEWWDPGLIVSDANFFDADSMTAEEIDRFLAEQVPVCEHWHAQSGRESDSGWPYLCLKDRTWDVPDLDVVGDGGWRYCDPVPATRRATSGEVISIIATACGISPEVLIVTLEKEQGLVTDRWPWQSQFDAAMGYACYDSAPCVDAYQGFVGQVYHAARSYQMYVQRPELFNYQPYQENAILYAPGCEAGMVMIRNAATAALYDYTPYQPNAEIIAGRGGDGCDAYGNYNFWRLWFFWFGDPVADDPAQARIWAR